MHDLRNKILSHRGYWKDQREKNLPEAFKRSAALGFGTETDIRDHGGQIVVSHDPPVGYEPSLADLLKIFAGTGLTLALNIKSDGLAPLIEQQVTDHGQNYFCFDMSGPEMVRYSALQLPFFTRHSDIELTPMLYAKATGVWLDAFHSDWFDERVIEEHLRNGKKVCIVSPELHGRDQGGIWQLTKRLLGKSSEVLICTDFPEQALSCLS